MFGSSLYTGFSYTGPLRGGHNADVAHGGESNLTPLFQGNKDFHLWRATRYDTWHVAATLAGLLGGKADREQLDRPELHP